MKVGIGGSGPTGVAAAAAALKQGHTVEILDFGGEPPAESLDLAARLVQAIDSGESPTRSDLAALMASTPFDWRTLIDILPLAPLRSKTPVKSIMGSNYVYDGVSSALPVDGAAPPRTLTKGGLSNVWGTACYRLSDGDYIGWPLESADLEIHYTAAAELLGLSRHGPIPAGCYPPRGGKQEPGNTVIWNTEGPLSALFHRWRDHYPALSEAGLRCGRSSLATSAPDANDGTHCRRCGLCFYGCPFGAMFRSGPVIDSWRGNPAFSYRDGVKVDHFREESGGVDVTFKVRDGSRTEVRYDRLVLAAGTLSSLRIVADSLCRYDFQTSLFDNDMYVVPMLVDSRAPKGWKSNFALSEGVMTIEAGIVSERRIHLQFYAFNDYFLGGAARLLPPALRPSSLLNRIVLAFVYLHSDDSREAVATPLSQPGDTTMIRIDHHDRKGRAIAKRAMRHLRKYRKISGLTPIDVMRKTTPFGFSGHLAGTLPMTSAAKGDHDIAGSPHTKPSGLLAGTTRVFVADASNFPNLPAQNPTFTAMANAMRIAENI